jgi:hypothetical protein
MAAAYVRRLGQLQGAQHGFEPRIGPERFQERIALDAREPDVAMGICLPQPIERFAALATASAIW